VTSLSKEPATTELGSLRGLRPSLKSLPLSFNIVGIKREAKRGEASLNILPPLLPKERGIKGVRLISNLKKGCLFIKLTTELALL